MRDIEMQMARKKQATKASHRLIWNNTYSSPEKQKRIFQSVVLNIKIRTVELDFIRKCL